MHTIKHTTPSNADIAFKHIKLFYEQNHPPLSQLIGYTLLTTILSKYSLYVALDLKHTNHYNPNILISHL